MIRQDGGAATANAAIINEAGDAFLTTEDGKILATE